MGYDSLKKRAAEQPVVADLPPLSEFYLSDITVYESVQSFERDLHDPDHQFTQDVVIDADDHTGGYPLVGESLEPFTPDLNKQIDWSNRDHYNRVVDQVLCQSSLNEYIVETTTIEECVAVVIVDGLSYASFQRHTENLAHPFDLQPVFVDGISTTEEGFQRVIHGNSIQSIYAKLNMIGFTDHIGFTYWKKGQEELSTDLYRSMHEANVHRIRDFEEIRRVIEEDGLESRTYLQITRMGLDQESHNRKERPDISHHVDRIFRDLILLQEILSTLVDQFRIYLTADHGIIWRDQLRPDMELLDIESSYPRHVDTNIPTGKGLEQRGNSGSPQTALAYPYLTRDFKHTEWGMHGGLSYQESFVPLIEITHTKGV